MIMIVYNRAIDLEVIETLNKCGLASYTKWKQAYGKGKASGPHFGSEVWPGENYILMIAAEDEKKNKLIEEIKELRKKLGKEGIKAFAWPLEEIT